MIHIIDPSLHVKPSPGRERHWELSLTDHQLQMAYVVAEKRSDGRFNVVKGRFLRDTPRHPITREELTAMVANALAEAPSFQ